MVLHQPLNHNKQKCKMFPNNNHNLTSDVDWPKTSPNFWCATKTVLPKKVQSHFRSEWPKQKPELPCFPLKRSSHELTRVQEPRKQAQFGDACREMELLPGVHVDIESPFGTLWAKTGKPKRWKKSAFEPKGPLGTSAFEESRKSQPRNHKVMGNLDPLGK